MDNFVRIFDTTLRDGEQSPGATLTSAEKLEIARSLALLGVDVMEAGFPAASPDDLEGVRRIANEVGNMPGPSGQPPIICGLARAVESDIDKAWQAVYPCRTLLHTLSGSRGFLMAPYASISCRHQVSGDQYARPAPKSPS